MLKIKNLYKSFGNKVIFENFSYEFDERGIYVIKGDSGIGKTTLLRIISGLDKNFKGDLIGGGVENVSFCFQEYRLFDALNALENITKISFQTESEDDITASKNILSRLGFLSSDYTLLPRELSGGMKQRVSFARAVMKDSPILILDEPTKEVDSKIREEMKKIIVEAARDRLVLIVTHNEDDVSGLNASVIKL